MQEAIEEYREWLEFQHDMAEDARLFFEDECPNEIAATRAEHRGRAFRKALEEFNRLFPEPSSAGE